jgi:hypothetical protein
MFLKATLILTLFPGLFTPSLAAPARSAPFAARAAAHAPAAGLSLYPTRDGWTGAAVATAARAARARAGTAARATERKLLLVAPHVKQLRRFIDQTTGLVKTNVTAHCAHVPAQRRWHRHAHFLCRVWTQPRPSSTGVRVNCRVRHHVFRVTAYHGRRRS